MLTPFRESLFLVYFTGDGATSCLIEGWDNVVRFINEQLQWDESWGADDTDSWNLLGWFPGEDDRYTYSESVGEDCGLHIIRVTHEQGDLAPIGREYAAVLEENERLKNLISCPHNDDWFQGVRIEAAHQQVKHGSTSDRGKTPADWFWLIGYLAGKLLRAVTEGDSEKSKHHSISTAAVLLNWYRAFTGENNSMRPGTDRGTTRVPEVGAVQADNPVPYAVPSFEQGDC